MRTSTPCPPNFLKGKLNETSEANSSYSSGGGDAVYGKCRGRAGHRKENTHIAGRRARHRRCEGGGAKIESSRRCCRSSGRWRQPDGLGTPGWHILCRREHL